LTIEYHLRESTYVAIHTSAHDDEIIENIGDATINSISGAHLKGKSSNDVTAFDQEYIKFSHFPKNFHDHFDNLQKIRMKNSQLKKIHAENLENLEELKILDLTFNKIEFLESNLFAKNPKLEEIYLTGNIIKFVHPNAFSNPPSFKILDFIDNECFSCLHDANNVKSTHHNKFVMVREIVGNCSGNFIEIEMKSMREDGVEVEIAYNIVMKQIQEEKREREEEEAKEREKSSANGLKNCGILLVSVAAVLIAFQ
jgi:Leucine-rich repeat (LRR) protein